VDGQNVRAAWEILFIILSAVYRRGFGWAYHNQGHFGLKGVLQKKYEESRRQETKTEIRRQRQVNTEVIKKGARSQAPGRGQNYSAVAAVSSVCMLSG
ncbi:MAG: hypothetical protein KKH95_05000, partial [Gammaproteobacteria bacterium]|nr:hypothetical protein [Gammaproteobacteria bacterium]